MTKAGSDVSVIICTYTEARWNALVEAVDSIQRQTAPPLEIIISVDHNRTLLSRVRSEFSGVVVVENERARGLSGARNSGIAVARGRKIAFLDDDATADPDWLARLAEWFNNFEVLGAGGKTDPVWQGSKPTWFPDEFGWVVGYTYIGMQLAYSQVRNLTGSNMCIRREVFDSVGGFRSDIGRVGGIPLGCEETELCIRARQHWPQRIFIYEPRAVVHHKIHLNRARMDYFRSRCYAEGLSKAFVSRLVGVGDGLASERAYTLRTLPRGVLRGIRDAIFRREWAGLARASTIIMGLIITTIGFLIGSIVNRFQSVTLLDQSSLDISNAQSIDKIHVR